MISDTHLKPIPGYDGYFASSDGHIWSHRGWRGRKEPYQLREFRNKHGYYIVELSVDQGRVGKTVHNLVSLAWFGHRPKHKPVMRHLNGDQTDNRIENLCYGTQKENRDDTRIHGRMYCGSKHNDAKLNEEDVKVIRCLRSGGESLKSIAALFDITISSVSKISLNHYWKHVS